MADDKKKHHRSSPYPAFGLAAAIQKAKEFEAAQGRNWVRADAATATWGYKTSKSGPAARSLATVRGFGLFDHKGGGKEPRKVRLSELGRKILFLQPDDNPQRLAAVRQAATLPKMHSELLKEFPSGLPADVAIENYLLIERNFNPNAVGILLKEWKATYKYARLDEVGSIADEEKDIEGDSPTWQEEPTKESAFGTQEKPRMPQLQSETRDHTIPLADGRMAILRAPVSFTDDDYRFLSTYLHLMKGALVDAEALHEDQEEPEDDAQESDD